MCFNVTKKQDVIDKVRKKRTVWKRVRVRPDGTVVAKYDPDFEYHTGVVKAKGRCKFARKWGSWGTLEAGKGIYVYTSKHMALMWDDRGVERVGWKHMAAGHNEAVIRLLVDEDDFLYTDNSGVRATYRQVTVPENQPFIEWYD